MGASRGIMVLFVKQVHLQKEVGAGGGLVVGFLGGGGDGRVVRVGGGRVEMRRRVRRVGGESILVGVLGGFGWSL